MAGLSARKLTGQGSTKLPQGVFGERFHGAVVWEAARAEQAALRRGTAATKTRGLVRGGGSKPWRQKGTGRARSGSIRAPHWTGGGTAFGPAPRGYTLKVNRKARRRALRSALSVHAERGSIAVLDPADFAEPSTQRAAEALEQGKAERPVLVLLGEDEEACSKSFRNLEGVSVLAAEQAGVADVMSAATLVASSSALETLERVAGGSKTGEGGH
jgi:large subunit ribosomal protein L4